MPTNRTRRPPREAFRITLKMVRLYARGLKLQETGRHTRWEAQGGRREEWFNLARRLHRLLGSDRVPLWAPIIFDCDLDVEVDWPAAGGNWDPVAYRQVQALRRQLEDALQATSPDVRP